MAPKSAQPKKRTATDPETHKKPSKKQKLDNSKAAPKPASANIKEEVDLYDELKFAEKELKNLEVEEQGLQKILNGLTDASEDEDEDAAEDEVFEEWNKKIDELEDRVRALS
ncbi:hypothetical protein EST38_g11184 [Candolleomyces aberdarensis]|uniref:Uncharacterized protein n=1 Tax=Candolleomyces aberdarensis TaxID=2316362 RepID=A0A4Q2D5G2_9AGAR|nr:hypothetical protein EST38_g11184 [Candolleomyces aberdarensis]